MVKYIFQTLQQYFGRYSQTILATTKTLRFYNGRNGLTEFTCKNPDWIFFSHVKTVGPFLPKTFWKICKFYGGQFGLTKVATVNFTLTYNENTTPVPEAIQI